MKRGGSSNPESDFGYGSNMTAARTRKSKSTHSARVVRARPTPPLTNAKGKFTRAGLKALWAKILLMKLEREQPAKPERE